MTITNTFAPSGPAVRLRQLADIHRKCLLLLLARPDCTAVQPRKPG